MILRPGLAALSHSWWKAPLQVLAPLSCALTLRRSFASRSCIAVSSNQHHALACAPALFLGPYLCAPVQLTTQTLHTDSIGLCLGKNVRFAPRSLARTSVFLLWPHGYVPLSINIAHCPGIFPCRAPKSFAPVSHPRHMLQTSSKT